MMLNKNLLLLNTTLNDYYTRPFGDVFYDESTEIPPPVSPYINDQRMLRPRVKTILEMRPDLYFNASYGVLNNGVPATNGGPWTDWVSLRGGITDEVIEVGSPVWLKYGIANRPSTQWDGSTRIRYSGTQPLNGRYFTVIIQLACQDVTSAGRRMVLELDNGTDTRFIQFGVSTGGYAHIYTRDTTKLGYYIVTGSTLLGTIPHTILYTFNQDLTQWAIAVDGEWETLTPGVNGFVNYGFSDYGTLNVMRIGGWTERFAGQVGLIAAWNKRI